VTAVPLQLDAAPKAAPVVSEAIGTRALCKQIDERAVLDGIDLQVHRGQFVALLGANGAGKSTLLKVLATLTPPTSGELILFGKPATGRDAQAARARIGMIAHQSMLYRDLSARENLEFFARVYGVPDPRGRARQLLELISLPHRADDAVKAFSRGMTQRVAIARALVHDPDLLLADEPFDGLDAPSIATMEQMLSDLSEQGTTVILANHSIDQSLRLADRAVVLRGGRVVIDAPSGRLRSEDVLTEMEGRS
jgi:heme exporter protein A